MDMRCSAKDLIRNHLTMSLYQHAAIWPDKEQWSRSYFCNGYLNVNGKKMSKSNGNFTTVRDTIDKFGVDASRIALCDAGDGLDDANFEDETANAAILKLFVFEGWIKTWTNHCVGASGLDPATDDPATYDQWDRIFANELNNIIDLTETGYREFRYKNVTKHAFNEILSLKEAYLIGK